MLDQNKSPDEYADAYLHLLMTQEEAAAFEAQCKRDPEFRRALEEAERRKQLLESAPPVEASERLVRDTLRRIQDKVERRARNWRIYRRSVLTITAAAVVLIAGFQTYFTTMKPSPYNIRLLGQSQLLANAQAVIRVAVSNERTGKEVIGVPVTLTLVNRTSGESEILGSFTSGPNSSPQLEIPDWDEGEYELRVVANLEDATETFSTSLSLTRQWKLMLSSDKPMYQPGQTIHLRSLALRKPNLQPADDQPVTFTITDPKGNVIFKHRATTSEFGVASADCSLATEILEGPYTIDCAVGEVSSEKTVTVEKYVLPKFRVGVVLKKPFYQPGEVVEGEVQADYFFGQPVAGGDVKIEVRGVDVEQFTIASEEEKSDANGRAAFQFKLPDKMFGREQRGGNAQFTLVATVTDTAGQSYSRAAQRTVTTRPIQLQVIPEAGRLVRDVENKVYLFANYVDGRPAEVEIMINGAETATTSKLGVAEIGLTPKSESVGLTLVARDEQGLIGRKQVTLSSTQVAGDFVVRTDKASYRGGETITITAFGGGVEPVFVDLLKDGQTVLTTSIEMVDGSGAHQVDLPPNVFGTLKLAAYRFNNSGVAVRQTKLLFARQARQLQVSASLDQQEYRPGEMAKLNLKLTDDNGQPVVGAVSLAAVDEAVFALLGQRPGMEEAFFLLEQEMLEPVYAIYDWDPFSQDMPKDDFIQLEQAIFSATTQVAGGGEAVPQEFSLPTGLSDAQRPAGFVQSDFGSEARLETDSPYTLAKASYRQKHDQVERVQRIGLRVCRAGWWSLLGVLLLTGWATALALAPRIIGCLSLIGFTLAGSIAVTLPAIQARRETAAMFDADNAMPMDGAEGAVELFFGAPTEAPPLAEMDLPDDALTGEKSGRAATPPRVRQWFPETLFWRPQVITDQNGEASVEIPLADSITTWRLNTSAVSSSGQLGGGQSAIRVFQPFFVDLDLPVALTRNDAVSVPLVVYNYLDESQTVSLDVKEADWFTRVAADGSELLEDAPLTLELKPREIRSLYLPLVVKKVGRQTLEVSATGSGVGDAIRKEIEVISDGVRHEQVASGILDSPAEFVISLPEEHIDGSARAIVKLYPTTFSQLVEGLDAIFRMPSGCFEQTSSTTYPNVLALEYLRRNKLNVKEVEAKARQYIHTGYQRLVTFEVNGGGFDWFGNPPANQTLTAYGLMEFEDMARVHDVDPQLIERTRSWLLSKRQDNGRWVAEPNMLNDGLAGSVNRNENQDLATTAYIAWAVFGSGKAKDAAQLTLDYLLAHEPGTLDDPYLLAVTINCIASIDPDHASLGEYFDRLESMKVVSEDQKQVYWKQPEGVQTTFYGQGRSGDVETTAMAALAMLKGRPNSGDVPRVLSWLIAQKDSQGTWHSTQATVLSLKALTEATGAARGDDKPRQIEIALHGEVVRTIDIPVDQAGVMQQINLSDLLKPGEQELVLTDRTDASTAYQIAVWYHVDETPGPSVEDQGEPLLVDVQYNRQRLQVDDWALATATVVNNMKTIAPMVILDLPIPGGFKMEPGELEELVGDGKIAKYQITARKAIVYLRGLRPAEKLELNYRLRATMPVKVTTPPATAYEYYNPDIRGVAKPVILEAGEGA